MGKSTGDIHDQIMNGSLNLDYFQKRQIHSTLPGPKERVGFDLRQGYPHHGKGTLHTAKRRIKRRKNIEERQEYHSSKK